MMACFDFEFGCLPVELFVNYDDWLNGLIVKPAYICAVCDQKKKKTRHTNKQGNIK